MSPPAVAFRFTTGRGGEHPAAHLAGYQGYLQADGYAGYNALYRDPKTKAPRGVTEVGCWAHARRKFTDILEKNPSPVAAEAVVRIGELFAIERDIKGAPPDARRRVRKQLGARQDGGAVVRVERRRHWRDEEKLAILKETTQPGVLVAAVARRHGIGTGQLYTWRKQLLRGAMAGFVPVELVKPEPGGMRGASLPTSWKRTRRRSRPRPS